MTQPQLPRQQDPATGSTEHEHHMDKIEQSLENQISLSHEPATFAARKVVVAIILWFVVLACGFSARRPDAALHSWSQQEPARGDRAAEDVVTTRPLYHLDCDAVLAELDSLAAYNSNATLVVPAPISRPAVPESPQATVLHPELALLMDLCPLLQDTHADELDGYTYICDGSQYVLPCHMQARLVNSTSLARFTFACNKHHSCRSWWLQHQSQHGVCGCAPLMNLLYPSQHAAQAEQLQKTSRPALPSLSVCLWMLVPFGRLPAACQNRHRVCAAYSSSQQTAGTFRSARSRLLVLIKTSTLTLCLTQV